MTGHRSAFWTFSLTVYGDPAVQQECLELQDDYGIDVNLLLFCAFVGAVHGALLPGEAIREAAATVGGWHDNVVGPLRAARRALKPLATEASPIAEPAADLRIGVKAAELEAERIEQMMLEDWAISRIAEWPRARPADAVSNNIQALFAMRGPERTPGLPGRLVAAALTASRR